ncbi:Low-density lipoprotein receptor domain class A [Teladorsagia circumcincta]|uniref:Low-density lipoprotein receptor domain class A n=1 Tax=Teladorsagia circumcincta TaxID=45464 RepID=A0A2G9TMY8_TELCI|nr:Low-density lipoprotein receptor domain class A [Teladorsagia circumcincta]
MTFACANGRCINGSLPCDRNDDCGDASDEIGCDVRDGYYCHCRDGFKPDPTNPFDCVDIDECAGNNTCTQLCLNTKGSYLCRCHEDYENNVVVGAMTGKDCRAKAEQDDNDIIAIAFDARRALQFWLDGGSNAIFRASEPNGNQSHAGQKLDLDFNSLGVAPTNLAVDYLTG